jgi:hypothetical protein
MMGDSFGPKVVRLVLPGSEPYSVVLEPWGEEFTLRGGDDLTIQAEGSAGGELEISLEEACIVVFGWEGSIVRLFSSGKELGDGCGPRTSVPELPPGMRVSEFVVDVLGGR